LCPTPRRDKVNLARADGHREEAKVCAVSARPQRSQKFEWC